MKEKNQKNSVLNLLSREAYLRELAGNGEELCIRLTNDYAFRKIFKNKKVMRGFLLALLNLREEELEDLEIVDPYEEGESDEEKEGILDVKVKLSDGKRINVEMQNRSQGDWIERSLFYQCRMFVEGFQHGQPYRDLAPCIHVGILDFNCLKSPEYHHVITLRDEKTNELYSGKFMFHVVELKKLKKASEEERKQPLYRWARLIAAGDWKTVCAEADGNEYMEAARDIMASMSKDERERYLYLRREMAYTDEISRIQTAREEGRAEGKEAGRAEGKAEGITLGESRNRIILVQKKLRKGKSLEQVADELEEEVEDIRGLYDLIRENMDESADGILEKMT